MNEPHKSSPSATNHTKTFVAEVSAYERRWKIAWVLNGVLFIFIQINLGIYVLTPTHKPWALTTAKFGVLALIIFSLWMLGLRRRARRLQQNVQSVRAYNPELRPIVESVKKWK